MNAYEHGFAEGERAAFKDRRNAVRRERPETLEPGYQQGWWDGYLPRSQWWGLTASAKDARGVHEEVMA
jgi:hypothetical protein